MLTGDAGSAADAARLLIIFMKKIIGSLPNHFSAGERGGATIQRWRRQVQECRPWYSPRWFDAPHAPILRGSKDRLFEDRMAKKTALVVGATGIVGLNLAKHLLTRANQ
jgi:hypothetical protein